MDTSREQVPALLWSAESIPVWQWQTSASVIFAGFEFPVLKAYCGMSTFDLRLNEWQDCPCILLHHKLRVASFSRFRVHHFWGQGRTSLWCPWHRTGVVFAKQQVVAIWSVDEMLCKKKNTAHCVCMLCFSCGRFARCLNVLHQHKTAAVHDRLCFLACHWEVQAHHFLFFFSVATHVQCLLSFFFFFLLSVQHADALTVLH